MVDFCKPITEISESVNDTRFLHEIRNCRHGARIYLLYEVFRSMKLFLLLNYTHTLNKIFANVSGKYVGTSTLLHKTDNIFWETQPNSFYYRNPTNNLPTILVWLKPKFCSNIYLYLQKQSYTILVPLSS